MKRICVQGKTLLAALLCSFTTVGSAQMLGVTVEVDTVFGGPDGDAFDPAGELDGFTSYLVYANFTNPTDVLSAIYSDTDAIPGSPSLTIDAPCGCYNPETSNIDAMQHSIGPELRAALEDFYREELRPLQLPW